MKLKLRRTVSSYVYRDISPEPSTSMNRQVISPRKKKLISKCSKLKKKVEDKQRTIKNLRAKTKRIYKKLITLETVVKELHNRPGLKDHINDISIACSNETLKILIDRVNDKRKGKLSTTTKYDEELKKFALTLHFYSPKAYNYIREKFDLCLPHLNTLKTWYNKVDCEPGFTSESFNTIKEMGKKSKLFVNLTFDEMSIREYTEWVGNKHYGFVNFGNDMHGDDVEIAKEVLVFMVVAVNGYWKLPVGYFPSRGFTASQKANLLKLCLDYLSQCNCEVMAITFDGLSSNLNMAKILGANLNVEPYKSYFRHKGKKYYIMLDCCHLLKLIRNLFADKKILIDAQGGKIDFEFLEQLNIIQFEEGLHLANKITFRHIYFHKQIMKVRLAAQLLSRSVATALEYCEKYLGLPQFKHVAATVSFLKHVNDIFDIFNFRNLCNIGFKKPLSKNNNIEIFDKLDEVYEYFSKLKFEDGTLIINSKRRLGFAGFLMNIITLKWLYVDYIEKGLLIFLPLYKFSQDHLETFFSAVRSKGGFNNNPTIRNFASAYRRLLCHNEIKISESGNCLELEKITILSPNQMSTVDRINTSLVYNKITKEFTAENSILTPEMMDYDNDFVLPNFNENLSTFTKTVVEYVAGFVVKKIIKSINCEVCIESLLGSPTVDSLIGQKDFSDYLKFLTYPSEDVFYVCLKCETYFRENLKMKFNITKKNFEKIVLRVLLDLTSDSLFLNLNNHIADQEPINSHRYLIIKYIVEVYFDVRLKYESKLKNMSRESLRNYLNKIVLFSGQ